jgi:hypothetical protein
MLAIRGVYNDKTFKVFPTEPVPEVQREVPVAIIFLEDVSDALQGRQRLGAGAKRMRAAREAMTPLGVSVKDLVEEERDDHGPTH